MAEYTWIKSAQKEFFKDKSKLKQFQIKLGVYLDTDIFTKRKLFIKSYYTESTSKP